MKPCGPTPVGSGPYRMGRIPDQSPVLPRAYAWRLKPCPFAQPFAGDCANTLRATSHGTAAIKAAVARSTVDARWGGATQIISFLAASARSSRYFARSARCTPLAHFWLSSIRTRGRAISPAETFRTSLVGVRWGLSPCRHTARAEGMPCSSCQPSVPII